MSTHSRNSHQSVLVFLRAPERGCVKTRLAKTLGDEMALALYRCFVEDTLCMIEKTEYSPVLCYHPKEKRSLVADWLGEEYVYWPQKGVSLGDKMSNALQKAFDLGIRQAVVLGTDTPDLSHHILAQAFETLDTHHAVVGPALDGGYYLVGFDTSGFFSQVFQNIPWGTSRVFNETIEIFHKNRRLVSYLPAWQDIDEEKDLRDLIKRHAGAKPNLRTLRLITERKGFGDYKII